LWCEAAWVTPVGVASVASSAFDLNPGCSWLDDPSNVAFAAPVSAAEAIYGTARLTEGGAVPLLQRLAPIYLGPGRSIRQPLCGTLRVMSPESRRHTSLGLVRGLNKPLADHESSLAPQRRLFIGAIPSPLDIRADGPISSA
jgi:hypothetical protein